MAQECTTFGKFTRVLIKRLMKLINGRIPDNQFGFRMGRSRLQTTTKLLNDTEESLRMMDERRLAFSWATPRHSMC
jgi:hypothetical protein